MRAGWLSDRIGDVLHQLGLMPLLSGAPGAAAVRIAGVHSIAKSGKPLAAAWGGGEETNSNPRGCCYFLRGVAP